MSGREVKPTDPVSDEETLYRSVRPNPPGNPTRYYRKTADGRVLVTSSAFDDRSKEPSVNRAAIWPAPAKVQFSPQDGVIQLKAKEVRHGTFKLGGPKEKDQTTHQLDVVPRPTVAPTMNPSHAVIITNPDLPSKNSFRRVKERLARLANEVGVWCIPPP